VEASVAAERDRPLPARTQRQSSHLLTVSLITAGWAFWYAIYRAYYGFGGTVGMFGTPVSEAQWQGINLAGAALLLGVAVLPVAVLPLWKMPRARPILLGLCWLLAVGFTMHALINDIQRVLSLAGVLQLDYPLFTTVNRRVADLQDLIFNETWFLVQGVLWGILGWINLRPSAARRWWIGTAVAAIAVLTCVGLLTSFGLIGKFIIG
jgi:hypothetical protein